MEENNHKEEQQKDGFSVLLDPKYPLLKEFKEQAPGTFKHSQALSSMIEAVAMALNLEGGRLRVAALYHDIGKMFNPKNFAENQLDGEEILHETLDPKISYELISRHISDSVLILINDHNFPRDIIEIVGQHHGTTMLRYFYLKHKQVLRYRSTKPSSIDSMVLMICDQIEATSKSLIQAGKFDPNKVLNDTITGLIDDGQFDNVTMKLGDLKKIKSSLAKELEGLYQKRVDYDSEEDGKE